MSNLVSIIMAGGRGSRFQSDGKNKTAMLLNNKPLVRYGYDLFDGISKKQIVVVGAFAESVKDALKGVDIAYAVQDEPKGTGDAARVGIEELIKSGIDFNVVAIGNGDHLYKYDKSDIEDLILTHEAHKNALTIVTAVHSDPVSLAWGRVVTDVDDNVIKIVEQKDATEEELEITQLNTGFYFFSKELALKFIEPEVFESTKSEKTGEYYVTDAVRIANELGLKVGAFPLPFEKVGSGINTREQLERA